MPIKFNLSEILKKFDVAFTVENYGNGHINDTYISSSGKYILQRINTDIFKNPYELMENIQNVTAFIGEKISAEGGDRNRETLTVIKTKDGKNFFEDGLGNAFRVYNFVSDTVTIDGDTSDEVLFEAGKGFGKFQRMLDSFPADKLYETIPDFHNTPQRFENLKRAVDKNIAYRRSIVENEIEFAFSRQNFISAVTDAINEGLVPLRVTHNDTKINNILFDAKTRKALCVIDLDTVMPGSSLYDFGDALRYAGSTAAEDETDLNKVEFNISAFESFAKGFLGEVKDCLTDKEIELLPLSVKLMTFECGMRFLTDYLEGDTYFKTHYENHNLDRARNQFKLVRSIEQKEDELKAIIDKIVKTEA